ncbi:MAG: haloalkane dehalogenase [Acidimicrobiia bacterium]
MDKQRATVNGKAMAYVEAGHGEPIVFLHGNPTSSHLWRNIIPHLSDGYRCIAPDLIGMGDSDKLDDAGPGSYRLVEHREYLDGLLEALDLGDRVTLVVHDWGSALGFDWANRHRDRVVGIAYMEALVMPVSWDDWPDAATSIFQAMRSDAGESIVIDKNIFVERILPASVLDPIAETDLAVYRAPYVDGGETRRPTLTWPREIPIDGEPADVVDIVEEYGAWLAASDLPKLFINADPGMILTGRPREFCRTWPNQSEVTVRGLHFIQEDSPVEIAAAIRRWRDDL